MDCSGAQLSPSARTLMLLNLFLLVGLPITVIVCCYIGIMLSVRKHTRHMAKTIREESSYRPIKTKNSEVEVHFISVVNHCNFSAAASLN